MNQAVLSSSFSPESIGGALRKGMQRPDALTPSASGLDGASRVAILLLSIGPEAAADILKVFSPKDAQRVSALMASVKTLDRDVVIQVLQEFKAVTEHDREIPFDPDGFMRQIMSRLTAEVGEQGWQVDDEVARNLPVLETLSKLKPELLHRYLKTEHPQVTATLLALVPPELSARVLDLFDLAVRNELVLRVALLDRINPNSLSELNDVLERALSPESLVQLSGVGGVQPVVEILNNFSGNADKEVLQAIRAHDPRLADDIVRKLFTFEDFARIDAAELQKLLPKVSLDALAVALKGAPPSLRELFVANMTQTMKANLRVQMDSLPPVRVQEVQTQQRAIVRLARQMAERNELSLARDGVEGLAAVV